MDRRFLLILVAIVVLLGGIFIATKPKGKDSNTPAQATQHIRGNTTSKVNFTEYGDFQCPACEAYYPIVEQVYQKYQDKVAFQFRNFPLVQLHPHAMEASKAAEAASNQGKFWEMYKDLYDNQPSWANLSSVTATFEGYAQTLGLDLAKYRADVASSQVNATVNADIQAGQKLQITGTPTFILNGKKIEDNPRDIDGFSKLLDDALASQK